MKWGTAFANSGRSPRMNEMKKAGKGYVQAVPIVLLAMTITTFGRIIYVDDDAAGSKDGSSWDNAYVYLQDALADANSAIEPIEIHVAQGI